MVGRQLWDIQTKAKCMNKCEGANENKSDGKRKNVLFTKKLKKKKRKNEKTKIQSQINAANKRARQTNGKANECSVMAKEKPKQSARKSTSKCGCVCVCMCTCVGAFSVVSYLL